MKPSSNSNLTPLSPIDENQLTDAIRSLVNHFVPVLKETSSLEQAEETLRNAEETDESFHRLDLVTLLTNRIESGLSNVLDKEVEKQKLKDRPVNQQMQIQERIVSNILQSNAYSELRREILSSTKQAVEVLNSEYVDEQQEQEATTVGSGGSLGIGNHGQTSWAGVGTGGTGLLSSYKRGGGGTTQYSFSEDSSMGGSSYNTAGGFGFIGIDRFKQIIAGLDPKNSTEIRRTSMTNLCRINPSDILDEVQNPLKSVIFEALTDSDGVLADKAFAFIAKLLSNSSVGLTKSVYVSFIDYLTAQFGKRRNSLQQNWIVSKDGGLLDNEAVRSLILKFRLVTQFHHHVSKYWIRYPSEYLMEAVITATVNLLSLPYPSSVTSSAQANSNTDVNQLKSVMLPINFVSFLDPTGLWFKTWIHGSFSRNHLLEELSKNKNIVENAVVACCSYSDNSVSSTNKNISAASELKSDSPLGQTDAILMYTSSQIKFVHFVHSINVLTHLLRFKKARKMFPISNRKTNISSLASEEEVSIETVLLKLLNILINPPQPASTKANYPSKNSKSKSVFNKNASQLVKCLFKTLASEELPCNECLCSKNVIEALMQPVATCVQFVHDQTKLTKTDCYTSTDSSNGKLPPGAALINVADVLTNIVSSKSGRSFFKTVLVNINTQSVDQGTAALKGDKSINLNPCEVLCAFTVHLLKAQLPIECDASISIEAITECYIFLCRQLYNHDEEFDLMKCEKLVCALSSAWKDSSKTANIGAEMSGEDLKKSVCESGKNNDRCINTMNGINGILLTKWQNIMVDNLLNLAATSKGLSLLLKSGAIDSCAVYMFGRYSKKLQVSRCEKFGYGVLVSRISSCAAGMKALKNAGFLSLFVSELWTNIECCPHNGSIESGVGSGKVVSYPYIYPTEAIDQYCIKSFNSLVNVLSSFPSLFELFHQVKLSVNARDYTLDDAPDDVVDLIDRLVVICDSNKMESLFNQQQSHVVGLRLINCIFSSLDSFLLLQTQYNVIQVLLCLQQMDYVSSEPTPKPTASTSSVQKENKDKKMKSEDSPSSGYYIINMALIERCHVLVRILSMGGDNERVLPIRNVNIQCSDYKYELFHKLPLPSSYLKPPVNNKNVSSESMPVDTNNDLSKFLSQTNSTTKLDQTWIDSCASLLITTLKSRQLLLSASVSIQVLEKALTGRMSIKDELFLIKDSDFKSLNDINSIQMPPQHQQLKLSDVSELGIKMIVKYGLFLKVITGDEKEHINQISKILIKVINVLKGSVEKDEKQEGKTIATESNKSASSKFIQSDYYPSMDWFVSVMYLVFSGDANKTCWFLINYSNCFQSICIWPARGFYLANSPANKSSKTSESLSVPSSSLANNAASVFSLTNISSQCRLGLGSKELEPFIFCIGNIFEQIVEQELPNVSSAFRISGYAPCLIAQHWMRQCFINFLNWPEIVNNIVMCITCGVDYQIYLCVAILKHLSQQILFNCQQQTLLVFLKEEPIVGFRTCDYVQYMTFLYNKYHDKFRNNIHQIFNTV